MIIDGYYVDWKEQCDYCENRNCEYQDCVHQYMDNLNQVSDKGCYGTLTFKCDYFMFDKELYNKLNPGECNSQG